MIVNPVQTAAAVLLSRPSKPSVNRCPEPRQRALLWLRSGFASAAEFFDVFLSIPFPRKYCFQEGFVQGCREGGVNGNEKRDWSQKTN